MPVTPMQRALKDCKRMGLLVDVVERWLPYTKRRKDCLGFGDVLAVEPRVVGALLIQVTSDNGGNVAARVHKIRDACAEAAQIWLDAGNRIEVWGYAKRGPAGKAKRWRLRRIEVSFIDGEVATREIAATATGAD